MNEPLDENQIRTDFARLLTGGAEAEEVRIDWSKAFAPKPSPYRRTFAVLAFLGLAVAANALTANYGPIPVGFGLTATAGTWAAGLVLLARDWVHDTAGRRYVLGCIAVGALLSAALTDPRLAIASAAAFALSELADLAVYTPLRRKGWVRAAVASNIVGSAVDTLVFLTLAGFPVWTGMPGQMLAKITATVAVVALVVMARGVLRNRVRPSGA